MQALYAAELEDRFFLLDEPRSVGLRPVQVATLDSFLRSLLFTDGTVTRALEAHLLRRVVVDVVAQADTSTPLESASWLKLSRGERATRRRVTMTADACTAPVAYAESFVVPARLPSGFMTTLSASPRGLGESLHREHLESRRELLSFGLSDVAAWVPAVDDATALVRLYRLVTGGSPAMLITESFLVEPVAGIYRLAASSAPSSPGLSHDEETATVGNT